MTSTLLTLPTPRDLEVFAALDRCPLTVTQLHKLSTTFASPFTTERKLRARLQTLAETGRVRRFQFAIAGRGTFNYYALSPLGYALLHGPKAPKAAKRAFSEISPARLLHTQALADFLVQTAVAAQQAGITLASVRRENTLRLEAAGSHLYPDAAFSLIQKNGMPFHFFVELDNGTEPVTSPRECESWERKLQFYDTFQQHCGYRFRVLGLFTRGTKRIDNVLKVAAATARNPDRSLLYAMPLSSYLAQDDPLHSPCFQDHRGRSVGLLSVATGNSSQGSQEPASLLASTPVVC